MSSFVAGTVLLASAFGAGMVSATPVPEKRGIVVKKKTTRVHPKTVRITVNKNGFSPSSINVEEGYPLTLIFKRTT
ncbi:MAG: hypothetical protein ABI539_01060 [Acidobacteriota bacterium]